MKRQNAVVATIIVALGLGLASTANAQERAPSLLPFEPMDTFAMEDSIVDDAWIVSEAVALDRRFVTSAYGLDDSFILDPSYMTDAWTPEWLVGLIDPEWRVGIIDPQWRVGLIDPQWYVGVVDPVAAEGLIDPEWRAGITDPTWLVAVIDPLALEEEAPDEMLVLATLDPDEVRVVAPTKRRRAGDPSGWRTVDFFSANPTPHP